MRSRGRLVLVCVLPLMLAAGVVPESSALAAAKPATIPQGRLPRAPQPYHGLAALADRNAWRSLDRFKQDDAYLSERVVYTDTVTGREVWRMTVHPGVDRVAYYDLPEWNADGSLLAFSTDRSPQELWVMSSNGGRLRPMPLGQLPSSAAEHGFWSVRDPNIWFACQSDDQGSQVLELDVRDGTSRVVARTARPHFHLEPPHPLEKHFLLARQDKRGGECEVVVLGRDGSEQVVPIGGRVHRLRFTKADNLLIFFNRDDPRTQWVIMPDGSGRKQLPDAGVHPDWTWDGSELTYFFDGGVFAMTPEGQRRRVFRTGSGGHGGPSFDGRFLIADQSNGGDYPSSIVLAAMDGSGRVSPVAYHGNHMWGHGPESQCHPDHHSTHPHPSFSPDGTKAVFSSYFGRVFTDVHVVVCRYPDPPRNLAVRREAGRALLSWTEPERHREIAGYLIFRQSADEQACEQVGKVPIGTATWTDDRSPSAQADYRVVAVEHSGLAGWSASSATDGTRSTQPSDSTDRPRIEKKPPAPPTGLVAKAMDSFHVDLRWTPPTDSSVCYYHVYSLSSPNAACTQANRIASPAEPRMVDWGRPPGTTQYYRVTAVDWFGNESTPSEAVSAVLPAMAIVNIELEPQDAVAGQGIKLVDSGIAEVGRVAMTTADAQAKDATLTWKLGIPIPAEYAVWVQQLVPASSTQRTARLKWGEGESWEWRVFGPFDRYAWWPVTAQPNSTPHPFRFGASTTTLQIRLPGEGLRLAKVLVTNDATRMPAEFGGPPVSGIRPAGGDGLIAPKGRVRLQGHRLGRAGADPQLPRDGS